MTFVLATLEISARLFETWVPSREVDFEGGFTPDSRLFREVKEQPGMLETHPEKTTFLHQEFQRVKPAGTLRVFVVGESSVHQLNEELPDLAERLSTGPDGVRRPVEIVNCGGGSYGSGRLLFVVGEIKLRIGMNLLALPETKLKDVRHVYSHPQGLGQSDAFLRTLKNVADHLVFEESNRKLHQFDQVIRDQRDVDPCRNVQQQPVAHGI